MVLGVSLDEVLEAIGHDGSEILWPDLEEPIKRRAFHIEELQYAALRFNCFLAGYSPGFSWSPASMDVAYSFKAQFEDVIRRSDGILVGQYIGRTNAHAVAWNAKEERIYDPNGQKVRLDTFTPDAFHAAHRA
jgi:hypothetical protein